MDTDDPTPWRSTEYVEPAERPAAWAQMATDLATEGRSTAEIAAALWVDVPTAEALLAGNLA
ncbi:hypothetical protein AB0958_19045 [Streptomyces sp. NPDC006655]|uniref:hypothetical protein n=1 Tax=Streptomyces sp. NPDC006655 TaxID=3156898 RepID=UPI003453A167